MAETTNAYVNALRGTPEKRTEVPQEMFVADDAGGGEMAMGTNTQVTPAVAPDPLRAYEIAMQSPDSAMRQSGMTQFTQFQQRQAEEQQAKAKKAQQAQLWQQSGGNPQAFLEAGGELDFAQNMVSGQTLGKSKVARTIETVDQKTGRKVNVMIDEFGNQVGEAVPAYVPPKAPPAPRAPTVIQTATGPMILNTDGSARPVVGPDGKPIASASTEKPLNEGQSNATTFGLRMQEADKILQDLEGKGNFDTGRIRAGVSGTLGALPLVGDSLRGGSDNLFNWLPSAVGGLNSEEQQTQNARLNFITAVLRKESGAAIGQNEYDTAEKLYFPAPGDSPAVVKQKQAARQQAIRGMEISAGPGASSIRGGMGGGSNAPTSSGW
jgi:hypothetical protein